MLVVAFCTLITIQAQVVSVESSAIRAKELIQELAKQSSQDLSCSAMLQNEPVICQFKNVIIEEALTHVATALGAEWEQSGRKRTLVRSSKLTAKFQREHREFGEKFVRNAMAARLADLKDLPPFTEDQAIRFALQTRLHNATGAARNEELLAHKKFHPVAIAVVKLLNLIGARRISQFPTGERVVFSDSPTRMQERFPGNTSDIIQDLMRACVMMQHAKKSVEDPNGRFGGIPDVGTGNPSEYKKFIIAIEASSLTRKKYSFRAFDDSGKKIAFLDDSLPLTSSSFLFAPPSTGVEFDLSQKESELITLQARAGVQMGGGSFIANNPNSFGFHVTFAEAEGKPINFGHDEEVHHPTKYDPIGFSFGTLCRKYAQQRNRNLIASASDAVINATASSVSWKQLRTTDDFIAIITQAHVSADERVPFVKIDESGSWVTMRAFFPHVALTERFSRQSLEGLIQELKKTGGISMYSALRHTSLSQAKSRVFSADYIQLKNSINCTDGDAAVATFNDDLRIVGLVGVDTWARLSGKRIRTSELNSAVRGAIHKKLYSSVLEFQGSFPMGDPMFRGQEPTELYPNGFPNTMECEFECDFEQVLLAKTQTGHYYYQTMKDLVGHQRGNAGFGMTMSNMPKRVFVSYYPAEVRVYRLKIWDEYRLIMTIRIREVQNVPGATMTSLDLLPQKYRDLYQKADADFRIGH